LVTYLDNRTTSFALSTINYFLNSTTRYKSLSELGPGDWKYRYIKVSNSHWIRGICVHTDSLYKFDPADFKDSVLAREKRLSDERVLLPFAGEKRIK
jgi:hypothetical protein